MSKESREQDAHCQSRANLSLLLCTDGNRRQSIIVEGLGLSGKVEGVGVVDGVVLDGAGVVVVVVVVVVVGGVVYSDWESFHRLLPRLNGQPG